MADLGALIERAMTDGLMAEHPGFRPYRWRDPARVDNARLAELAVIDRQHPEYGHPEHGTLGMYTNHRCRCAECKAAKRAYRQAMKDWSR